MRNIGLQQPYTGFNGIKNKISNKQDQFLDSERRRGKIQSGVFSRKNAFYYLKPGMIENADLLKDRSVVQRGRSMNQQMSNIYASLKEEVMEHFDFEAVPFEVWRYLKAWYSCDIALLRFLKRDRLLNRNQLFLELYPEKKHAAIVGQSSKTK